MSVFRFDPNKFEASLKQLEKNGQEFDEAQKRFVNGAQSATGAIVSRTQPSAGRASSGEDQWSGIGELDQFMSPLRVSMVAIDRELETTSRRQKQGIANLRTALVEFTALSEADRNKYLDRLTALDQKFTYRRPEEITQLYQSYFHQLSINRTATRLVNNVTSTVTTAVKGFFSGIFTDGDK